MSYSKLSSNIIYSTVYGEPPEIFKVWITMLALADRDGEVQASVDGLVRITGLKEDTVLLAIEKFKAPDPKSKTKDFGGARVIDSPNGWLLLNYEKYREMESIEDRKEKEAARQRRRYERKKQEEKQKTDALNAVKALIEKSSTISSTPASLRDSPDSTPSDQDQDQNKTTPDQLSLKVGKKDQKLDKNTTEMSLRGLYQAWYGKNLTVKGKPMGKEHFSTFLNNWEKGPVDLEAFTNAILWRLERLDLSTEPDATDYVGSLSNFLIKGNWKDETPSVSKTITKPNWE